MADNVTVTNQKTTFDASTNPDLAVRTSQVTSGKHIQHVRLDLGSGTTESQLIGQMPVTFDETNITRVTGESGLGDPVQITGTISGSVSATQSGTWNVTNISGTVSLPTGAATETTLSDVKTKIIATGGSAQQVQGPSAIGTPINTGNGFPCLFKDLFGNGVVPTGLDASGVVVMGVLPLDLALHIQQFSGSGEAYSLGAATANSPATARYVQVNSSGHVVIDAKKEQTILFASIDTTTSGDNTIVAADATKKIKVLSYSFVCAGTVNVRWKSGAGTNLSGAMPYIANTGMTTGPGTPAGGHLLETAVNTALVLNLSAAVQVSGHLSYYLEA